MTNKNADVMLMSWNGWPARTMTHVGPKWMTNVYVMLTHMDD